MALDAVCKGKSMALEIIETMTKAMKPGTQKAALEAVAAWIDDFRQDVTTMTPQEREARIIEIMTHERDLMGADELRERADFYLDAIMPKEKFQAMTPEEQTAFFKNGGSTIHIE